MKWILFVPILLLSFTLIVPSAHADITTGLVGYWNFDEGSGTTAADSSGGGNTGTLVNGPTWGAGKVGSGALRFDGLNDYVNTGNTFSSVQKSDNKTISAWVNPASNSSGYTLCLTRGYGNVCGFAIYPSTVWKGLYWGSTVQTFNSSAPVIIGQWVHVSLVQSGTNVTLYVNGVNVGSVNDGGIVDSAYLNSWIGAQNDNVSGLSFFSGTIDDVRIYNRALSPAEITSLYNYTGGVVTPPTPDTTAPSTPGTPSLSVISSSQINLSWTASTDNVGVTGYKVFRNGTQIATPSTNSYSDTGLTASTAYTYTVSAYDAVPNNSSQSPSAQATTQAVSATTYTLTISKSGTGSGTVTSSGGSINCGSTCSQSSISSGTSITLSATPTTDSTFAGWSGGGCTGTGTCVVIITTNTNITATYVLNIVNPPGQGTCNLNTYYIDFDNGNDSNNGKCTDTAWKHVPSDINAIGVAKNYSAKAGDTFQFKSGVVYRGTVNIINAIGTLSNPIIFKGTGWGSGKAIISGSDTFNNPWTKCDSSCGVNWQNIYYATIPVNHNFLNTDFFYGDKFLYTAQEPNLQDPFWSDNFSEYKTVKNGNITLTSIKDPTFLNQSDSHYWDNAYILIWSVPNIIRIRKITGFDPLSNTITFEKLQDEAIYGDRDQYYSIINSMKVLDKAGEYYFDEINSRIYLWPLNNPINNIEIGSRDHGISMRSSDNIVIDGFIVEKTTGFSGAYAISDDCCVYSTKISIKNNEVRFNRTRDSGTQGTMYLSYNNYVEYSDNYVHENRMTGILGTNNVTVKNNIFYKNGYKGLWIMGGDLIKVIGNRFSEQLGTHATDVSIFTSKNVLFANNMVSGGPESISFSETGENFIIHNNVLFDYKNDDGGVIRLNGSDVKGNLVITNNTVYGSRNHNALNITKSTTDPTAKYIIKNNIIDGGGDSESMGFDMGNNIYTSLSPFQVADPRYTDPIYGMWHLMSGEFTEFDLTKIFEKVGDVFNGGFKLKAGSVAIDKGVNISSLLPIRIFQLFPDFDFSKDIDGTSRPQGSAWDIGAYEYGGVVTPPICTTYAQGDFNHDCYVNSLDLSLLKSVWNQSNSTYDLNADGIVNSLDYVILVRNWTP